MTHDNEKARRYLGLLDAARCKGEWADVPEWARKVSKHAPHRKCLILTANTELLVIRQIRRVSSSRTTSSSTIQSAELAQLTPPLLAIEAQSQPAEDVFQCQACVAWIHCLQSQPSLAISRLPPDILSSFSNIGTPPSLPSDYTTLCMLRSVHIKARSQGQEDDIVGSLDTLASVVPWMHHHQSKLLSQPYFLSMSEQLRAQMALTASTGFDLSSSGSDQRIDAALQAFRHWAIFSAKSKDTARDDFGVAKPPLTNKIEIWKAYYLFLSKLLEHRIDHHVPGEKHTRFHQVAELRRIESTYGAQLLRLTRFPRANESNQVIEDWVEQIDRNWEIMCERSWPEADLGEAGRQAVGKSVLDLLYQAATKSFHSTRILRHLFQVHKSVYDFDLAYRAFDSYLDLAAAGKLRDRSSHEKRTAIDDNETIWRTVAQGIEGLCMSGRRDEAEKAFELAVKLDGWTQDHCRKDSAGQNGQPPESGVAGDQLGDAGIHLQTLDIIHRAVGIGTALWATWTAENERRTTYRNAAIERFNQANRIMTMSQNQPSAETAYAQAILLAEKRDLRQAIDVVKTVLSYSGPRLAEHDLVGQRKLLPLWHLLALLLSARQDLHDAHQICRTVLGQFDELDLPPAGSGVASSAASSDINEKRVPIRNEPHGLCDDMGGREKEGLIEIKMTELALLEIMEGAEEAINASNGMLSLCSVFSRQLGVLGDERSKAERQFPKSAAGTGKGFREKLFGRKSPRPAVYGPTAAAGEIVPPAPDDDHVRHSIHAMETPTIQITDEDPKPGKASSLRFGRSQSPYRSDSVRRKLHKKSAPDMKWNRHGGRISASRPSSSGFSSRRQSFDSGQDHLAVGSPVTSEPRSGGYSDSALVSNESTMAEKIMAANSALPGEPDSMLEAKTPLPLMVHNAAHTDVPPPAGHEDQPPQQDIRLPTLHATTSSTQPPSSLPRLAEQVHAHGVLVKVWLFVAGLYRRASLFDDSKEACDEASKSAWQVEALIASQESSAGAFADPGWGRGQSSNQLQADVHVERACLAATKGSPHEAIQQFEEALMYSMDQPKGTVGLSNLLLDIFEGKIRHELPQSGSEVSVVEGSRSSPASSTTNQNGLLAPTGSIPGQGAQTCQESPEDQNRLAARDRAYGLLSNLTKLGTAWDDSEAWFALARAYQCSEQPEKEKEVLQWCVELEDSRPVRHWRNIGPGLYVL